MESPNPYASPRSDLAANPAEGQDPTGPFDPSGRFTRLSWLAWTMLLGLVSAVLIFALLAAGLVALPADPSAGPILPGIAELVVYLLGFVGYLLLSIRRFHDTNASGWWSALLIVPIVSLGAVLFLLFKRGDAAANRFGPPRPTPGWERFVGILAIVLMVLVLVLGILAAIAIPAYQDYLGRAQGL